jgi:hypothetical protein
MSLWEMQDLGGCRFVVPTVQDVYKYAERFELSRNDIFLEKNMTISLNQNILVIVAAATGGQALIFVPLDKAAERQ